MNVKLKKSFSDKTLSRKDNKINDERKNSMVSRMRSISDKTLLGKQKNRKDDYNQPRKCNRFLIIVNVFGSSGPLRFVVNEEENAAGVIQTALKLYARMDRLPILGSDINNFFLYPIDAEFDPLEPSEAIGSRGLRNFVLCKKEGKPHMTEARSQIIDRKGSGWRTWIQKSLSLKILS